MNISKLLNRTFATDEELFDALKMLYIEDKVEYIRQRGNSEKFPLTILREYARFAIKEAGIYENVTFARFAEFPVAR